MVMIKFTSKTKKQKIRELHSCITSQSEDEYQLLQTVNYIMNKDEIYIVYKYNFCKAMKSTSPNQFNNLGYLYTYAFFLKINFVEYELL